MKAESQTHDDDVARRLRERDPRVFRSLSERHLKPILNYAYRILGNLAEAEDVSQETFLKLWQQAPSWEPRAKVNTWLFRVAHNSCIDRLRRRRDHTADDELGSDSVRPSRILEQRLQAEAVREAVAELPLRQRSALVMSHFDGMSNPEIAEVLDVSVEATESLLSRARRNLKRSLGDLEQQNA